jgi:hypothetical protein
MYLPSVLIGYLEAGEGKGADERARGPPTCSLRVIHQALNADLRRSSTLSQDLSAGCHPRSAERGTLAQSVCGFETLTMPRGSVYEPPAMYPP